MRGTVARSLHASSSRKPTAVSRSEGVETLRRTVQRRPSPDPSPRHTCLTVTLSLHPVSLIVRPTFPPMTRAPRKSTGRSHPGSGIEARPLLRPGPGSRVSMSHDPPSPGGREPREPNRGGSSRELLPPLPASKHVSLAHVLHRRRRKGRVVESKVVGRTPTLVVRGAHPRLGWVLRYEVRGLTKSSSRTGLLRDGYPTFLCKGPEDGLAKGTRGLFVCMDLVHRAPIIQILPPSSKTLERLSRRLSTTPASESPTCAPRLQKTKIKYINIHK